MSEYPFQPDDQQPVQQPDEQQPAEQPVEQPVQLNMFGRPKKKAPKKSLGREIFEWVVLLATAVVLAFVIRSFIGELVKVDGNSMYATLHDGEVMIVDKLHYGTIVLPFDWGCYPTGGEPERFDVVICHYPGRGNTNFVKRVVGLPGDIISIIGGYLYVNGERYEEAYLVNRPNYYIPMYTVPEGMYFVLGDNRSNSNDSHIVGPISRDMIIGHVRYVISPWPEHRVIPNGLVDTAPRRLEPGL